MDEESSWKRYESPRFTEEDYAAMRALIERFVALKVDEGLQLIAREQSMPVVDQELFDLFVEEQFGRADPDDTPNLWSFLFGMRDYLVDVLPCR